MIDLEVHWSGGQEVKMDISGETEDTLETPNTNRNTKDGLGITASSDLGNEACYRSWTLRPRAQRIPGPGLGPREQEQGM